MTTNELERAGQTAPKLTETASIQTERYFIVCAPPPPSQRRFRTVRRVLRKYFWRIVNLLSVLLLLLASWWSWNNLSASVTVIFWWCEVLAAALLLFTIWLFSTFRQWGQERQERALTQPVAQEKIPVMMCTPPPLENDGEFSLGPEGEFIFVLENWPTHPAEVFYDANRKKIFRAETNETVPFSRPQ